MAVDTIFTLSYSVLMLNTDLHNPKNIYKMTKESFIKNLRGTYDGRDWDRRMLEGIYGRIQEREFKVWSQCFEIEITWQVKKPFDKKGGKKKYCDSGHTFGFLSPPLTLSPS